jgi:Putative restriction endonuclease
MHAILGTTMVTEPLVSLRYRVGPNPEAWVIPEGPVPESTAHTIALDRIYSLLLAWAARVANGARIARNLAIRWLPEHPTTGIDPDVCVLLPGPKDFEDLSSLRLWEPGRTPPPLAIEVASASHPYKDYTSVHERYAALGARELLVFDPLLVGPKALGGPVSLQLWRRDVTGVFERVHFASEPVYCQALDAWFIAEGRNLHIAEDRAGARRWPTETEEARGEASRAQAEVERAQRDLAFVKATREREQSLRAELEAKIRELEAERKRR